jgi:hypothetical protein
LPTGKYEPGWKFRIGRFVEVLMGSLATFVAERASMGASRVVRSARRARRAAFEALGSDRYSNTDVGGMDRAVAEMLGRDGTFLEVGLGDGIGYATTQVLERDYGWHGLLVEVIPAGHTLSDIPTACASTA